MSLKRLSSRRLRERFAPARTSRTRARRNPASTPPAGVAGGAWRSRWTEGNRVVSKQPGFHGKRRILHQRWGRGRCRRRDRSRLRADRDGDGIRGNRQGTRAWGWRERRGRSLGWRREGELGRGDGMVELELLPGGGESLGVEERVAVEEVEGEDFNEGSAEFLEIFLFVLVHVVVDASE